MKLARKHRPPGVHGDAPLGNVGTPGWLHGGGEC
jgi:hypothetical protein